MTSNSPGCAVCGRPSEQRLCSPTCVREAVHERERNVRNLRTLRRNGGDDAGADLVGRNAQLTGALLTQRPPAAERTVGGDAGHRAVPATPSDGPEELTQPFTTPVGTQAATVGAARPVA